MHSNLNWRRNVALIIRSYPLGNFKKAITMASILYKWVINRFLKDNQLTKFGVEDPYYEYLPVDASKGKTTKYKKVARTIPRGLLQHDIQILLSVKSQAYRCDMWFNALGLRFGLSSIVGLVPILGSIVTTFWSLKILYTARQITDGLPLDIQLIFLFNIVVDFLLSLIPFVGDIVEVGYKANLRNFLLLEKHLERVGKKNMGLILDDEVRPGFINDQVQPFLDKKVKPQALKAGAHVKQLVNRQIHSSPSSLGSNGSGITSEATTQSTIATITGLLDKLDDDNSSIKSLHETKKRALESDED